MASVFDHLLTHTYTRTPVTAGVADEWNIPTPTPGNASPAEVCFYNPTETARINEQGATVILGPVLLVAPNSVLAVGDRVSSIAGGGSTLEAGPLTVESIEDLTLRGAILQRRARLKRAESTDA